MKGLLLKDWQLLKLQKTFILLLLGIVLMFLLINNNPGFVVGYIAFVSPMLLLSSISYDETNNGLTYLFTMPIVRKDYVTEKYVLGLIINVVSTLMALLMIVGFYVLKGHAFDTEWLIMAGSVFLIQCIFLSYMIPMEFKFGSEKGRIMVIMIVPIVAIVGYGVYMILNAMGVDLTSLIQTVESIQPMVASLILIVMTAVLLGGSYLLSIKILNKKEL